MQSAPCPSDFLLAMQMVWAFWRGRCWTHVKRRRAAPLSATATLLRRPLRPTAQALASANPKGTLGPCFCAKPTSDPVGSCVKGV